MGLVGNHNNVVSVAIRLLGVNVLIELVYQAEDVAMILLESFLKPSPDDARGV